MQTILIQDDPDLFRHLEDSLLRRSDLRLLTAATAAELLARSRSEQPDLVVLGPAGLETPAAEVERRLAGLPRPPVCLRCPDPDVGRGLEGDIHRHLGVALRRAQRHVCHLPVRLTAAGKARRGITRDLAAGGVYVATPKPYPVATKVSLRLRAADGSLAVQAEGEVVRAVTPQAAGERLPGMAIRFLPSGGLDAATVSRLADVAAQA
jgi:hypothetical protein